MSTGAALLLPLEVPPEAIKDIGVVGVLLDGRWLPARADAEASR